MIRTPKLNAILDVAHKRAVFYARISSNGQEKKEFHTILAKLRLLNE